MAEAQQQQTNPWEGYGWSEFLRGFRERGDKRLSDIVNEVPHEIAANVSDLNDAARYAIPGVGPVMLGRDIYNKFLRKEWERGPSEVSPAPFARHSDDPAVTGVGMALDPSVAFLGGAGAIKKVAGKVGEKASTVMGDAIRKLAPKAEREAASKARVPGSKAQEIEDVAFTEKTAAPEGPPSQVVVPAEAPEVLPPEAKAPSKARKNKKAIGTVFDEVDDVEVARRMARNNAHIKTDAAGKYIGAPDWVDSPGSLRKMRSDALEKVKEGVANSDWYDRQRALAVSLARDDPARQALFARGTAAYSPQAMPKVELPTFLRQHNEKLLTGEDVRARTDPQMRNVAKAYDVDPATGDVVGYSPEKIRLGKKTGPYADAKDPTVPEGTLYKTANDIWHGRVMGYGKNFSRGFTPQEHGFLTGENLRLADAANEAGLPITTPRQAQAATWLTTRMDAERSKDLKRFNAETRARARYEKNPEKWGRQNYQVERLRKDVFGPPQHFPDKPKTPPPKNPRLPRTEEELQAYGTQGLDTAEPRQQYFLTSEAVPGAGTGHLADTETGAPFASAPDAVRAKYTADILRATGRDPTIDALGLYARDPVETRGVYTNTAGDIERNPGWAQPVMVSNVGDSSSGIRTPRNEKHAMDLAAQTAGLLRGQEFGAGNRFLPQDMSPRVRDMNSVRAKGLTPEQVDALVAAKLDPVDVGGGVHHVTRFGDDGPIVGTQVEAMQRIPGSERGTMETTFEPGLPELAEQGKGEATTRLLDTIKESPIRNLEQRLDQSRWPGVAKAYNEIDSALAQTTNRAERADLMRLRDIIAKSGFSGLRAHVAKYGPAGLPVALLGALGLQGLEQEELSPEGGGV